jgi:hypothetical protein
MQAGTAQRVRREISWLSRQGLDWITLSRQVSQQLRRVVPYDSSCWHRRACWRF